MWVAMFRFWAQQRLALPQPAIFTIALLAAAAFAGLAGYVVGLPSLRLRGDYLAIVTLGFGEIIRVLWTTVNRIQLPAPFDGLNEILGSVELGAARGFTDIPLWTNFAWTFGLAILCILTVRNLAESSLGRSMRAVREDEVAAEAAGVNTTQIKVLAFVISSMWAGVAGALGVHLIQYANPNTFNFMKSVEIVVMVVLGGLGSITGAALTAVLLKILEEVLRSVNGAFITGLLLIAVAIFWSLPRHRAMLRKNATRGLLELALQGQHCRCGVALSLHRPTRMARNQCFAVALCHLRLDFSGADVAASARFAGTR